MKIYYKTREIDYKKTLGELDPGEKVDIPITAGQDLANIRTRVMRVAGEFGDGRKFSVNKTSDGASITRTS